MVGGRQLERTADLLTCGMGRAILQQRYTPMRWYPHTLLLCCTELNCDMTCMYSVTTVVRSALLVLNLRDGEDGF